MVKSYSLRYQTGYSDKHHIKAGIIFHQKGGYSILKSVYIQIVMVPDAPGRLIFGHTGVKSTKHWSKRRRGWVPA